MKRAAITGASGHHQLYDRLYCFSKLEGLIQQHLDLTADIKEIRSGVGWTSVG